MKVLVSGGSGLVGSALSAALAAAGASVAHLSRTGSGPGRVAWDPAGGTLDAAALEAFSPDAVVHLAGENIASGRWTPARKASIRRSRAGGTSLVAGALAAMAHPPKVFVSASAVGFYGDRGAEAVDEDAPPGRGFLADTCRAWEAATAAASTRGIRTVRLRIGMVLDGRGGALARMLPLFRLGLGGRLGDGRQYQSWIAMPDLLDAIRHVLAHDAVSGPVNAVSPDPATNAEFTRCLGAALGRPALLPVPAFALRLALGEMADELLLSSTRAVPKRLLDSGFAFRHPALDAALRAVLA